MPGRDGTVGGKVSIKGAFSSILSSVLHIVCSFCFESFMQRLSLLFTIEMFCIGSSDRKKTFSCVLLLSVIDNTL